MLNVTNDAFILSVVMLRVVKLRVVMLRVVILSVVILSVVVPPKHLKLLLKANGDSTIGRALH
jgi:hypothetical protein